MRDGKLDFFKGLLIWSVVLGHCMNVLCPRGNMLHMVLRLFDLPMFMYISGFLMRGSVARYDWKQLIVNKITNIAFPAIVWIGISLLLGDLHSYYFLWAVFVSSVVVCLVEKLGSRLCQNAILGGAILVLVAVIFHLIPKNIVNISFLFPFFIIGYFTENISKIGWKTGIFSTIAFILLVIFVWQPTYTIWNTGGYILQDTQFMLKVVLLRLIIGITGIYTVVFVIGGGYEFVKNSIPVTLFEKIGKQTLAIYMMQHVVVEIGLANLVGRMDVNNALLENSILVGYVLSPLISFLLLYAMYYIAIVMGICKYTKWMFGVKMKVVSANK